MSEFISNEPVPTKSSENYTFIIFISIVSAIAGLLFGFDTGVINGAQKFIDATFHITDAHEFLQAFVVSSVPGGAFIGAVFSGMFSNVLGRRGSIIFTACVFILGTACVVAAHAIYMVILGRLLIGFSIGLSAMIVPMYLAEISPPNIRGSVVFLFQLAITIGIMLAFIINYVFAGTENWRGMFAVGFIPSVLLGIGMLFLPRSPRWLLLKGREPEATRVLAKLHRKKEVEKELADIKLSLHHTQGNFKDLFTRRLFPLVIIAFGLFVFQQLSGINTIFYYSSRIFAATGYTGNSNILAAVITGVVNVVSTLVGIWLIDKLGRRKLLFIGCIGMVICLSLIGLSYHGFFGSEFKVLNLILVLIYIFFFAISLGGIAYIMMAEIFPLKVRGPGMATASCANWAFNFLVTSTFLVLVKNLGLGNTFLLYAFFTLIALLFAYFLVPETKGRALEDIEKNLYAGKSMRRLGDPV